MNLLKNGGLKGEKIMVRISDLIKNIAKGQSGIPMRLIFAELDKYYQKVATKIQMEKAQFEGAGTTVFLKIPSETKPKILYDIVFWFNGVGRVTQQTEFKVYSNSPKFGFNYTYLFHQADALLYPTKYPKIMITKPPKVRNPYEILGFDKHIYACMRAMLKQDLIKLVQASDPKKVVNVADFTTKLKETEQK